ncbi:transcriptional regulator [Lachnospiraceae bacterium JC7]|nr:transcriptional regulator [Lachnospiraceae bacterium JC7]
MSGKAERTKELILDRVYPLFSKRGFKQVTMKDVCEVTGLSRGGLYSHFAGTGELFEALLGKITEKDAMDFHGEISKGLSATEILEGALRLMEDEMEHPEDSLSIAMYEYAEVTGSDVMEHFNRIWEEKWTALIRYGIERGEFSNVNVREVVNVILFSYQGIRMWSRIIRMEPETIQSVTGHIRNLLIRKDL